MKNAILGALCALALLAPATQAQGKPDSGHCWRVEVWTPIGWVPCGYFEHTKEDFKLPPGIDFGPVRLRRTWIIPRWLRDK